MGRLNPVNEDFDKIRDSYLSWGLFLVIPKQLMTTFKELGLNKEIQQSLDDLGFVNPSPIQAESIPFLLNSKNDLIAFAQTGTGKTAAFSLPIIHQLEKNTKDLQAIILCPTRELCLQISKDIVAFTKHSKGVSTLAVYGGDSITNQINTLRRGVNIVVGTPGRVHDLIRRKALHLQDIEWLVLDEADEMLDMGFKDDLDAVLAETPETKQTLLFSATMSSSVHAIAKKYMTNAHEISVGEKNTGADNVAHEYYIVQARDRYEALRRLVDSLPNIYGILFCRTRRETQEVADKLKENHYNAEPLHGEITQNMRTQIMDRFRKRKIQLLVATDVAARGIDVNDLTHVINYNLPDANETYIHRSGRTGRAQKSGTSITILHPKEKSRMMDIQKKVGKTFIHKQVPQGEDICQNQLLGFIDKIKEAKVNEEQIKQYLPAVNERLNGLNREDLINHFISYELSHFLEAYEESRDLNTNAAIPARERMSNDNVVSFKINLGNRDGFDIKGLFGLINSKRDLKGSEIGRVDVTATHTIFGIDKQYKEAVISSLSNSSYRGKTLEVVSVANSNEPRRKTYNSGKSSGSGFAKSRGNYGGRSEGGRGGYTGRSEGGRGGYTGKREGRFKKSFSDKPKNGGKGTQ